MMLSKQLLSRGIDCQVCIKKQDLLSSLASTLQKGNYYQEISSFSGSVNLGESVISCNDLTYTYNKKSKFAQRAISDISLDIKQGEFVGVIGHTGSGKSTFIQHINRLIAVEQGSLIVNGYNLSPTTKKEKKALKQQLCELRKNIGMVFQYPENQLFGETVYFDVSFGIKNFMPKTTKKQAEEMISVALERVGFNYEEIKDRSPFELSGGQKRRIAIAGVIVTNPQLLILDEPLAGLDPQGKIELLRLLKNLFGKVCKTIIIISHDMDEIRQSCSRVIAFDNGKIALDGKPQQVFSKVQELKDLRLDIPLVSYLVQGLKEYGIEINCDLTAEGFIDSISRGVKA
jgi:energy-coupling factor transport system ATP-binding protein